ncbi:biopolymer transporter ExbD [Paracoccus aestuarii]|uniref:Biopolymer transporter ExbD n=1 Tax=Paracoccus aestuarii TaxID=453842 RepID=A0A418ZPI9_9RHOB|nr:biopolymer transporter ExbD [Paracoccus aestuarii]RJK93097.1 biopolymer transporter ExbD [Paracoccus aestuarii]WCQ99462.1 biopolymer transporter ExbD [Paracoccus aestuarii]
MRIDMPPRRPRGESIIPMINVVFLLLIFFLLTAQIARPVPFPLTPPEGQSPVASDGVEALFVGPDGSLAWGDARGEAVWDAIAARPDPGPVEIRADAALPAAVLAGLLARLRAATPAGARLVVIGG